jgi:hypothetical protein
MQITRIKTTDILTALAVEKEDYSLISKQLLAKTIEWIDRFESFPDIEFELEGDSANYLSFLETNTSKILVTVSKYRNAKRQHGPAKKALNGIKKNHVTVYFNDADFAKLCNRAGTNVPVKKIGGDTASRKKLAGYLRNAAFGAVPPRVPEVNYVVWTELAPVVANLNQIAHKLNKGMVLSGIDISVFTEINEKFTALRKQLMQVES